MIRVLIQQIGPIDKSLMQWLVSELKQRFPVELDVKQSLWPLGLDYTRVFDWNRMQFKALAVNEALYEVYSKVLKPRKSLVIGLISGDGYVEGLNFVFGLATPELSTATVYTTRLQSSDESLYRARVLKEVMHELGHLLGLNHCVNRRCVMSFSNSVAEVDSKEPWFCPSCVTKLKNLVGGG